jgi:hypothetical protein
LQRGVHACGVACDVNASAQPTLQDSIAAGRALAHCRFFGGIVNETTAVEDYKKRLAAKVSTWQNDKPTANIFAAGFYKGFQYACWRFVNEKKWRKDGTREYATSISDEEEQAAREVARGSLNWNFGERFRQQQCFYSFHIFRFENKEDCYAISIPY